MKILVVDDQAYNRALITQILEQCGHEVEQRANGKEACDAVFSDPNIDLVALDVVMPVMDGMEAAKIIRKNIGDRYLPILFITSLDEEGHLGDCLESGGDDFIPKPISESVLTSKINAHERTQMLYRKLEKANHELSYHRNIIDQEHAIVDHIFAHLDSYNGTLCQNINIYTSSMSMFNGDLVMSCASPSGGVCGIVGDFTGHGLGAAVGSLPVSEIFIQSVSDRLSVSQIAHKINLRLSQLLPSNMFFCASIFEIDRNANQCILWQGGMNDLILIDKDGHSTTTVQSRHLPLGVLSESEFDDSPTMIDLKKYTRFYIYTDGVIEAENPQRQQFGEERLHGVLLDHPNDTINKLIGEMRQFSRSSDFNDDVSVLEFMVDDIVHKDKTSGAIVDIDQRNHNLESIPWCLDISLKDAELKHANIVDQVMAFVSSIKGIEFHSTNIFTIISELYSNALEHGVLRLDSNLKRTPDGFDEYYTLRAERLEQLAGQYITIRFRYLKGCSSACVSNAIEIEIEDSGDGFDFDRVMRSALNESDAHGRGIKLLSTMCHRLNYRKGGRVACAQYVLASEGTKPCC